MRAIWFFGPTAAGKKTLLYQLSDVQNRKHELARELELGPRDLVLPAVIPNRIRGKRGQEYQDILNSRISLLEQIHLAEIDAVWLIHGQGIDIVQDILGRLAESIECDLSLAVYLYLRRETYEERAASRGVSSSYKRAYASADDEIKYLKSRFRKLLVWRETLDIGTAARPAPSKA